MNIKLINAVLMILIVLIIFGFYNKPVFAVNADDLGRSCIINKDIDFDDHFNQLNLLRDECDSCADLLGYKHGYVRPIPSGQTGDPTGLCPADTTHYFCLGVPYRGEHTQCISIGVP